MVAVTTLVGVIAAVILTRISANSADAKKKTCYVNKGQIDVQVQLWYRNKGTWPANNLSDISANTTYFPSTLPTCPVDGSAYSLDSTTHQVTGHTH